MCSESWVESLQIFPIYFCSNFLFFSLLFNLLLKRFCRSFSFKLELHSNLFSFVWISCILVSSIQYIKSKHFIFLLDKLKSRSNKSKKNNHQLHPLCFYKLIAFNIFSCCCAKKVFESLERVWIVKQLFNAQCKFCCYY